MVPKQKPLYPQINLLNLILKQIHGIVLIYTESKGLKSEQTKIFFDHTSEYECMLALVAAGHEHRKALESGWHISGLINN